MNKKLQKSFQNYLSKIKKPTIQLHHHLPSKTLSSSASCVLRGCKHLKTPSFAGNAKENEARETRNAATLSDIDRFLLENFSSLYDQEENNDNDDDKGKKLDNNDENPGAVLFESPRFLDLPEKFHDSHRFFVQRSSSGSIVEEARESASHVQVGELSSGHDSIRGLGSGRDSTGGLESGHDSMTTSEDLAYSPSSSSTTSVNDSKRTDQIDDEDHDDKDVSTAAADFITLLTYSADPYDDFKQSMHEMVQARLYFHGKVDWEFMVELLFCYLNLNDKKSYQFILRAFVDLVIVLREDSGSNPPEPRKVPGGRNGRCNESINK